MHPFDIRHIKTFKTIKYYRHYSQAHEILGAESSCGICFGLTLVYLECFHREIHDESTENYWTVLNNSFWKDGNVLGQILIKTQKRSLEDKLAENIKEKAIEYQKKTMGVFDVVTTPKIFKRQLGGLLKPLNFTIVETISSCAKLSSSVQTSESELPKLTKFITELLSTLEATGSAFIFMQRKDDKDGHIICMAKRKIKSPRDEISKVSFFDSSDGEVTFFYSAAKKDENYSEISRWLTDYLTYYGNPHEVIASPDNKNAEKRGDTYYETLKPYESIKVFYGTYSNPRKLVDADDEKVFSSPARSM